MYEIKIRFKNGEIGYFKLINEKINYIYQIIGEYIKAKELGVIELIDLADNKKTIIDITDISTFGYSWVEK